MDKLGIKNFKGWMIIKEKIDLAARKRSVKEGDVWWSSIGENVGAEICGKGEAYTRPVLVLRKLDKYTFWAVPLTSKEHKGSWYVPFELNGRLQVAVVSQIQNMSVSRLRRRMGQLTNGDYSKVFKAFLGLLLAGQKIRPSHED